MKSIEKSQRNPTSNTDEDYCIAISKAGPPNDDEENPNPDIERKKYRIILRNYLPDPAKNIQILAEYLANGELFNVYTTKPMSIDGNGEKHFHLPLNVTEPLKNSLISVRLSYYPENKLEIKTELATLNLYLAQNLFLNESSFDYPAIRSKKPQVISPQI